MVHLPIALAVLGLPLAIVAVAMGPERNTLRWVTVVAYAIMAGTGWLAHATGEKAKAVIDYAKVPEGVGQVIEQHEQMGDLIWIFAAVTGVLFLISVIKVRWLRITMTVLGLLASIVTLAWVGYAAHLGGKLVYQYSLGTPPMVVQGRVEALPAETPGESPEAPAGDAAEPAAEPAPAVEPAPPEEDAEAAAPAEAEEQYAVAIRPIDMAEARRIEFEDDVVPIFEDRCYDCHTGNQPRGGFLATTYEGILEGGISGPGVVPGEPDESLVVQFIRGVRQPRMPRIGDPLPVDELHIIRQWIAAGAPGPASGAETEAPDTGGANGGAPTAP
jgi:uncharacterized membrane protein